MYRRTCDPLDAYLQPNRVLVIRGPRRVGKTTLLQNFLAGTSLKYKLDSGDNVRTRQMLSSKAFDQILPYKAKTMLPGLPDDHIRRRFRSQSPSCPIQRA